MCVEPCSLSRWWKQLWFPWWDQRQHLIWENCVIYIPLAKFQISQIRVLFFRQDTDTYYPDRRPNSLFTLDPGFLPRCSSSLHHKQMFFLCVASHCNACRLQLQVNRLTAAHNNKWVRKNATLLVDNKLYSFGIFSGI